MVASAVIPATGLVALAMDFSGGRMRPTDVSNGEGNRSWTFLTNHSHVLICIVQDGAVRSRDIAARVGITERAVQRIVTELCAAGYVTKVRQGRRNRYQVHLGQPLRHPVEGHSTVAELFDTVHVVPQANSLRHAPR